jgi:hypothetical protein
MFGLAHKSLLLSLQHSIQNMKNKISLIQDMMMMVRERRRTVHPGSFFSFLLTRTKIYYLQTSFNTLVK